MTIMSEATEEILIARNRADEIPFENASVFVRSELYEASPDTDEEKLKGYTNTEDFWPIASGTAKVRDNEGIKIWVTNDDNRVPIKVKADLRVGSIVANLVSFRGLANPFRIVVNE